MGTSALLDVYRRLGQAHGVPIMLPREGERPSGAAPPGPDALLDRVLGIERGVPPTTWRSAYEKLLAPLGPGVYQLVVHLAQDDDEMRAATAGHPDWGSAWRQSDLDLVKSDAFQNFLKQQQFHLITWRELGKARLKSAAP